MVRGIRGQNRWEIHGHFRYTRSELTQYTCRNVRSPNSRKSQLYVGVNQSEGAAGFDGAEAAVINPIVDDLTGDLEVRRNIVGGEVVGSHDPSLLLDYN